MKVTKHITGTANDWTFTFDRARYNDWVTMSTGIPWDEQIKIVLPRLRGIEGIAFEDGTPITLEEVKAQEAPIEVYLSMLTAWSNAVTSSWSAEASAKNEQAPPSSDSSGPDSTSRG